LENGTQASKSLCNDCFLGDFIYFDCEFSAPGELLEIMQFGKATAQEYATTFDSNVVALRYFNVARAGRKDTTLNI
jgi:hypothetical protein